MSTPLCVSEGFMLREFGLAAMGFAASRTLAYVPRGLSAFAHCSGATAAKAAKIRGVSTTGALSRTIVLLDDDPDVGIAAQILLQRRVAPVICLRRPAEIMAALDRIHPALLLLDLNFGPGRTDGSQGLRLIEEIRLRTQPPAVVVMTAYAQIELAVQALKRGACDFIIKPWDNVRLVTTCRETLQQLTPAPQSGVPAPATLEPARTLAAQERAAVMAAVAQAQGNLSAAARVLGLSRAALYRRLEKYGL